MLAIVPAAGIGARLPGEAPKQYRSLAGRPMLWHAVRAVCVPPVQAVAVVLAPDDTQFNTCDWSAFAGKLQPLFCGGATRRDSVYNGLVAMMDALDPGDWVLVHDAARPCLARDELARLIDSLADDDIGGLLAQPMTDTVKRAEDGRAVGTEPRAALWRALTPQMFRFGVLRDAYERAGAAGDAPTDEAMAVERTGGRPRLVAGNATNIKVTGPGDLELAAAILAARAAPSGREGGR